jgi:hypothetical protein
MARRACVLLICGLVAIGLITGCGGGGSPASTPAAPKPATSTTTTDSTLSLAARLRKGIAACRKQVAAYPYIPASRLPAAKAACNGFKTGNIAPLRAILRPACEQEVRAKVPAAQQAAALRACDKAFY